MGDRPAVLIVSTDFHRSSSQAARTGRGRRAVGSLDDWQRSLQDIADGLATLKADTIQSLVRSLPDVTEADLAFEAAEIEASQVAGFESDVETAGYPSPEPYH
jgi:hypothetical protein